MHRIFSELSLRLFERTLRFIDYLYTVATVNFSGNLTLEYIQKGWSEVKNSFKKWF